MIGPESGASCNEDFFASPAVYELGAVFGSDDWCDPKQVVEQTQPWLHGAALPQLSVEQRQQAHNLLGELRLIEECEAPAGEYDQVVILGGLGPSNITRSRYAVKQLERPEVGLRPDGKIVGWFGPRQPGELELSAIKTMLADTRALPQKPKTQNPREKEPHIVAQYRDVNLGPELVDETGQGALVLHKQLGGLMLSQMDLRLADARPNPLVSAHTFRTATHDVVLMNGRPVQRGGRGEMRHTTESCAAEWITGRHAPQPGSRVLFVTSNPFIQRTTRNVQRVVSKYGAEGVEVVGCGPHVGAHTGTSDLLKEFARLAYENARG